uniref:Uncharacterized protein n=1 Tax=Clytia hemisphaerica TaxID=252671 RepID=A0A7M5X9A6_9CNID
SVIMLMRVMNNTTWFLHLITDLFEERLAKLESLNVSPSTTSTLNSAAAINAFDDAVNVAFHFVICADLSKPPVSLSLCCMRIVGCKACVERWHVNHANCPHCGVNDCTITSLHCFTTMLEKFVALREREL